LAQLLLELVGYERCTLDDCNFIFRMEFFNDGSAPRIALMLQIADKPREADIHHRKEKERKKMVWYVRLA